VCKCETEWCEINTCLSSSTQPLFFVIFIHPLPSLKNSLNDGSVLTHLVSHSLTYCPPLAGNFIGKGGAHADGTKSSGDKVHHISPLKLLATIIYSSSSELPSIWSLLSLCSSFQRADTLTIFLAVIPYLLLFEPSVFPHSLISCTFLYPFTFSLTLQGSGLASYVASLIDTTLTWNDIAWLRFVIALVILTSLYLTRISTSVLFLCQFIYFVKNVSRPAIFTSHSSTWTIILMLPPLLDMTERTQQ
jgi:hypothetical protein